MFSFPLPGRIRPADIQNLDIYKVSQIGLIVKQDMRYIFGKHGNDMVDEWNLWIYNHDGTVPGQRMPGVV